MSRIREIIEKYAKTVSFEGKFEVPNVIWGQDFDNLELELIMHADREVLEAIVELAYSNDGLDIKIIHKETK